MAKQIRTHVKIGNILTSATADVSNPGCRTKEQYEAVMNWHKKHPSAWWCNNLFEADGNHYKKGFIHLYFDDEGHFVGLWVTPKGTVRNDYVSAPTYKEETDAVIKEYGSFSG